MMGTVKRWFNALATMALTAICEAGTVSHLTDEEWGNEFISMPKGTYRICLPVAPNLN